MATPHRHAGLDPVSSIFAKDMPTFISAVWNWIPTYSPDRDEWYGFVYMYGYPLATSYGENDRNLSQRRVRD